jgi:N-acetylmuramoyl-L-alanine amidase
VIKLTLSASNQSANIGADGVTEQTRMHELANMVEERLPSGVFIVHKNAPQWSLARIVAESAKFGPQFHLALHSNAMGAKWAGKASGVEGWVRFGDKAGWRMAELLLPAVSAAIGLPVRHGQQGAAKITTVDSRGHLAEVDSVGGIPALILETFFHDRPADIAAYLRNKQAVAVAIVDAICKYFGVKEAA